VNAPVDLSSAAGDHGHLIGQARIVALDAIGARVEFGVDGKPDMTIGRAAHAEKAEDGC
jgi:hypothetical protein